MPVDFILPDPEEQQAAEDNLANIERQLRAAYKDPERFAKEIPLLEERHTAAVEVFGAKPTIEEEAQARAEAIIYEAKVRAKAQEILDESDIEFAVAATVDSAPRKAGQIADS